MWQKDAGQCTEHLRKAQKHLSHAENRLAKAGLTAPDVFKKNIWAWKIAVRELQVALYQEAIKQMKEAT